MLQLKHRGIFRARLYRKGRWVDTIFGHNDITTEGKNHLLDVVFHGSSAVTTWYIGLVDYALFASFLVTDTLASHSGWTELTPGTDYTGDRLAWVEAAASSGSITSSASTSFPILTTNTVYGILIASVASGTSGVLMATGAFDATIDVVNGDDLKVDYTVSY
jgi:hypothetical protein